MGLLRVLTTANRRAFDFERVKELEMEQNRKKGIAFAVLAAALYAINAPFSKILLDFMPPTLMAGFLYVGAGVGMVLIALIRKIQKTEAKESRLTREELPYTAATVSYTHLDVYKRQPMTMSALTSSPTARRRPASLRAA